MKWLPKSPRTLLSVAGVLAIGVIAAIPIRGAVEDRLSISRTQSSLEQIEREIRIRSQSPETEINGRGYPSSIDPRWFRDRPENRLVTTQRPWIDVAPDSDAGLEHPSVPIARPGLASFWYNPASGVLRARIPSQQSDQAAHLLYSQVNGIDPSELDTLDFAR